MEKPFKLSKGSELSYITSGEASHFFGYFDKSPWCAINQEIFLCHRSYNDNSFPTGIEKVEIGYWNINEKKFIKLSESLAWNYQQGSMLQWIGKSQQILFNDIIEGNAVARVIDLNGNSLAVINYPIAALSSDGKIGVSLNFARLNRVRKDYGYPALKDLLADQSIPESDGINLIDIQKGTLIKTISIKQIVEFGKNSTVKNAFHWVNHPIFSPDGTKVCFLHRYINEVGTRYTRMLVYDLFKDELSLLIAGMASHYGWRNNHEIIAWAGERSLLQGTNKGVMRKIPIGKILQFAYKKLGKPRFLKKFVLKDNYILFDINSLSRKIIKNSLLVSDGHCSFEKSGNLMVTDNYPDRKGRVSLLLFNFKLNQTNKIASFNFPPSWDDEVRCDLHPRWNETGDLICVDTVVNNKRQMLFIKPKF